MYYGIAPAHSGAKLVRGGEKGVVRTRVVEEKLFIESSMALVYHCMPYPELLSKKMTDQNVRMILVVV